MKESNNWQNISEFNPFKVPTDYFESFEGRMMARIEQESDKKITRSMTPLVIKWIYGAAAVLILGFIGVQQFYLKPEQRLLDQQAMINVIEYFAQDMDEASLATMMAENDVLYLEESNSENSDLLEWMDVDEMIIVEVMIEMANKN